MVPTRNAVAVLSCAALMAACTPEAAETPAPSQAPPVAAPAPATPAMGYACESGKTVSVQYPDTSTAIVSYGGQTLTLQTAVSASGARYSGSGVEWWTATRGGQETATLSRLGPNQDVGVAVLERCSRPTPSTEAPVAPLPTPTPAPGGVLPAAAACASNQLKLSAEGGDAGMGNRVAVLGVQNIGARACSLTGYPTVSLLDSRGRAISAIRSQRNPGNYFRAGTAPTPVNLAPQAKGYFDIAWNVVPHEGQGETTCPSAATVRFAAPGDTAVITLAQAFTPCGGQVRISPIRPVPEDTGNPAAA